MGSYATNLSLFSRFLQFRSLPAWTKTDATIIAMDRRNSLLLGVVVVIGAIALGLQAADEHNANYTVRILASPITARETSQWITSPMIPRRDTFGSQP
jgi:hypothetical protein